MRPSATRRRRDAADRSRAAGDRERAARDRQKAAHDRTRHHQELERAELDELTGSYRRGMGEVALLNELERARRAEHGLVLAYIDVDGLKEMNDRRGHGAGDALLSDVVAALRSRLRPYDPVVRWGGDEFICAISEATLGDARSRIEEIRALLTESQPGASISVGLAELRSEEPLETLVSRADRALLSAKLRS